MGSLIDGMMSHLIGKLGSLLARELTMVAMVYVDAARIKEELEVIKAMLKVWPEEEELSESVKNWRKQLRDVAELIEDVQDEYLIQISQRNRQRGFIIVLCQVGRLIGTLNSYGNLSFTIRNITSLLREIKERCRRYNLSESVSGSGTTTVEQYHPRFVSPFLDKHIVGIDSTTNELIKRLTGGEWRRSVILLVGTGGIGKTTLAKKVYYSEDIRRGFECRAWIDVSPSYKIDELLKITIEEISPAGKNRVGEGDMTQTHELIRILKQFLWSKRYMLVFDGIYEKEFWNVMKDALPYNVRGKYIAFHDDTEQGCPRELKHLSHEILRVCEGLPLAIIAVAGLLSVKEKTPSEWRQQLDSLSFDLIADPHIANVSKIIAFCLNNLPPRLKSCFLYFSIFREDPSISRDKLVESLLAEGLGKEKRKEPLERAVEESLYELSHRQADEAVGCSPKSNYNNLSAGAERHQADEAVGYSLKSNDNNLSASAERHQLSSISNGVHNVPKTTEVSQSKRSLQISFSTNGKSESSSTSAVSWHDAYQSSFSSYQNSVFSDDIEE
ncbi:hypothetical protein TIFTF001_046265 [Ficus carica]|uniref:Uncharacterized protein n=1 Tax=Ficus carica TaxID=3494 RepID=A0AA87ZSG6_FICCA|nr:hypothetical protein TIFTF001_046264 [Ficus carica]GMN28744.1 hypothetical protein TIFTF001_046265 [Ficus carica]